MVVENYLNHLLASTWWWAPALLEYPASFVHVYNWDTPSKHPEGDKLELPEINFLSIADNFFSTGFENDNEKSYLRETPCCSRWIWILHGYFYSLVDVNMVSTLTHFHLKESRNISWVCLGLVGGK